MTDADRTHQAQLRDMEIETVAAYLRGEGYTVQRGPLLCQWCATTLDSSSPGYPPRAEDDEPLPCEVGR